MLLAMCMYEVFQSHVVAMPLITHILSVKHRDPVLKSNHSAMLVSWLSFSHTFNTLSSVLCNWNYVWAIIIFLAVNTFDLPHE